MHIILFSLCVYLINAATQTTYSAPILLTYPQMENAGISGTMIYDLSERTIAFKYNRGYSEIFKFNTDLGYASDKPYNNQFGWKTSDVVDSCSPCAQYANKHGFPFTNDTTSGGWSSLVPSSIAGRYGSNTAGAVDSNNCRRYDTPVASNSWASYFGIHETTGNLCYIADRFTRLWTVTGTVTSTYNASLIEPPSGCKCLQPIDLVISLDRSGSISVDETAFYTQFVQAFAESFYFNSAEPKVTAQLAIVQWGTKTFPLDSIGSLNFTTNNNNVATAVRNIGCTTTDAACNFCYTCPSNNHNCNTKTLAPASGSTRCNQYPTQYTCTGCGIDAITQQFIRSGTTYNSRPGAPKVSIVITDGYSNVADPGTGGYKSCVIEEFQDACSSCGSGGSAKKVGCYTDIVNKRNELLAAVPDIETFAIGVGSAFTTTLDLISGDPDRSFAESNWADLLSNLEQYVLSFCPSPDPVGQCESCCGFCECGQCVTPDTPIPSFFCADFTYVANAGGCFTTKEARPDPCSPRDCNSVVCNNDTESCDYSDNCAPGQSGINPNFVYVCAKNCSSNIFGCEPSQYIGNGSAPSAPVAPSVLDPAAPACSNGQVAGTSVNGCAECICNASFSGIVCGIPETVDLCTTDDDCKINECIISQCVVRSGGSNKVCVNNPRTCDDGLACTSDKCVDSVGCVYETTVCNDGLMCTDDSCNPTTGLCEFVVDNCSSVADLCHDAFCDDFAASPASRCLQENLECPRSSNCSIAECYDTDGCVSTDYSCGASYAGIVAGIAAGIIAGSVVAAAFVLAAAMVAGGGYAISKTYENDDEGAVHVSPLYKAGTQSGSVL